MGREKYKGITAGAVQQYTNKPHPFMKETRRNDIDHYIDVAFVCISFYYLRRCMFCKCASARLQDAYARIIIKIALRGEWK